MIQNKPPKPVRPRRPDPPEGKVRDLYIGERFSFLVRLTVTSQEIPQEHITAKVVDFFEVDSDVDPYFVCLSPSFFTRYFFFFF